MSSYLPRVADVQLAHGLKIAGAVQIAGPRACGKTETARTQAASEVLLDTDTPLATLAQNDASAILNQPSPLLLDEWQLVPKLWNAVRREVDARKAKGQFILTGSTSPDADPMHHSGAGRILKLAMRTMSFSESGHSTNQVSFADLLMGEFSNIYEAELDLGRVVDRIVIGGWPGWLDVSPLDAGELNRSWLEQLVERDYPDIAGNRRNPRLLGQYLKAIAPLSSQAASFTALARRISDEFSSSISPKTISSLHDFAMRMYAIEDQPAWSPKLRSKTSSSVAPVRHLADPSLAAASLGASPTRLLSEPKTLGFLFESQVVHDIRIYAQAAGARGVFHYRDSKGRDEIDIVVEANDGNWVGIEVKLGQSAVDQAAYNLLRVADKIEPHPRMLIVITPTGIAHRRKDGVVVVPLTVLGA